jgi:hypothetical protein
MIQPVTAECLASQPYVYPAAEKGRCSGESTRFIHVLDDSPLLLAGRAWVHF